MIHLQQAEQRFNVLAKLRYISGYVNFCGVTVFAEDQTTAEDQADSIIESWPDVKEFEIHEVTQSRLGLKRFDIEAEIIYRNSPKQKHVFVTVSAPGAELAAEVGLETLRGWKDVQYVKIIQTVLKPVR